MPWRFNPFTGNLDETDIPAFNGEVTLGSAASPSIFFTGDPNTGIYSPGADQLALSTNGTGRLFVDASGNVGIGVSPTWKLDVTNTSTTLARFTKSTAGDAFVRVSSHTGGTVGLQLGDDGDIDKQQIRADNTNNALIFNTANSERLRITSAGLVGIGTSAPWESLSLPFNAKLSFGSSTFPFSISRNSAAPLVTTFSDGKDDVLSRIDFTMRAGSASQVTPLSIASTGRVGIGTTSPSTLLHLASATGSATPTPTELRLATTSVGSDWSATNPWGKISFYSADNSRTHGEINLTSVNSTGAASVMTFSILDGFPNSLREQLRFAPVGTNLTETVFSTSGTERARIDSSGRLLVGTSSTYGGSTQFQVVSTSPANVAEFGRQANDSAGPRIILSKTRGTETSIVSNNDILGTIRFSGSDGVDVLSIGATIDCAVDGTPGANDMPGRLVFSTTADGASSPTERMRIKSSGIINFSNAPVYADNTAALAGGLVAGDVYRKSDGTLMITY